MEENFELESGELVAWTKQKYDPQSGCLVSAETRRFNPENKKLTSWVREEFNKDNQVIASDAVEFGPETGKKTSQKIFLCNKETGRRLWSEKRTFGDAGQLIHKIHEEHEPPGPMRASCLEEEFDSDGKLKLRKETKYYLETFLRISEIEEIFDSQTGNSLSKRIERFDLQGNLLTLQEERYDPKTSHKFLERRRDYDPQGRQTRWEVVTFDRLTGKISRRVEGECRLTGRPEFWLVQSQLSPVTAELTLQEEIKFNPETHKRVWRNVKRFDPESGEQTFGLGVDYDQAGHPTSRKVTLKRA